MATRSTIAILNSDDGSVDVIYCHWDGYVEGGVGQMLFEHYNTPEKVKELIALDNINSLKETTEKTIAYNRNRGEELIIRKYPCVTSYRYNDNDKQEYNYLYIESTGQWFYTKGTGKIPYEMEIEND